MFTRTLFLLLFFSSLLFSKTVVSEFKVTFGLFGEVGVANATLKTFDDGKYTISVVAKSTGLAKVMSSNKQETYMSEGYIDNGVFKPTLFRTKVRNNSKEDYTSYAIDYDKREIIKKRSIKKRDKEGVEKKEKVEEYFTDNDLLTLFFNISNYIEDLKKDKVIVKKAIGGSKVDRNVEIELLDAEELRVLEEEFTLDPNKTHVKVTVNQKLFSSEKGELYLALDENYFCQKAVLKDVVFFGDIVGTEVYKREF